MTGHGTHAKGVAHPSLIPGVISMKVRVLVLSLAAFFVPTMGAFAAAPSTASTSQTNAPSAQHQLWAAWGGTIEVRWNRDLAGDIGMHIASAREALPGLSMRGRDRFTVRRAGSIEFHVEGGYFRGFDGGSLQATGGYSIELNNGDHLDFVDFRLVPSASDPLILNFVGNDGQVWFYIDRLMYELLDNDTKLSVGAMDMRISPELAKRIGHPETAGWAIADLAMTTDVQTQGFGAVPMAQSPHWPGDAAPDGGTYQADLFMQSFTMSYTRCQGCTGPSGTGSVVFTPSSTLKNNVNNGTAAVTIPGQGNLGTSAALWTAGIAWNQKFTGNFPPYGNDQHPFLIWNLYRTNADGRIEQVGRSGVKHAWLTTNGGCADNADHDSHILGRSCSDTYGTGNNDTSSDLGPRSEIVPADGIWGRCGSIYDAGCVGSMTATPNGSYDQRLVVREDQISPNANPSATYLFESWYIARDDINPYNSMGSVTGAPSWTGSAWAPGGGSSYKLGPVIDRWVDPANPGTMERNKELAVHEGHAKLAVKVKDLGDGTWRYDYALMNVDFARAVTNGTNPNIRVVRNNGFDSFAVPVPADADVSATWFSDGDTNAANDWTVNNNGGRVTWTAPTGNMLNWGTLFSFSITVNKAPVTAAGELHIAEAGSPAGYVLETLAPTAGAVPDPVAAVTPASIGFSVNQGGVVNSSITVANNGGLGSSVNYTVTEAPTSCASPSDVAWLSALPASGSVSGGSSANVAVKGDATTLAAGSYSAKLCLATNDAQHPSFEVPVSFTVNQVVTHKVGGSVSGASGALKLKLNGGSELSLAGNGAFQFPNALEVGSAYAVTVSMTPAGQICSVANGSGTMADSDVTNVAVNCTDIPPQSFPVGGRVRGVTGPGLVLQLNGGLTVTQNTNGLYNFVPGVPSGAHYDITVQNAPAGQSCTVANGSGTMGNAAITNVDVTCAAQTYTVGGTVSGLSGSGLVLLLNGAGNLPVAANGDFTFANGLASGATYAVTVGTQPSSPAQACTVSGGNGQVASLNVTNVVVTCAADNDSIFVDGFEAPVRRR